MRIVKFRIYDKLTKSWSEAPLTCQPGKSMVSPEKVLQQFTGVYDKKGKEIYEGDYIRGGDDHIYFCLYADRAGSFVLWRGGEDVLLCALSELEVVGNMVDAIPQV
jgi:hypothetical protein